jgi:hypothetical protein
MRVRAPALLLASLAACAFTPAAASAADTLNPYSAEVTADDAAELTTKAGLAFAAVCKLASNRKSVSCAVSSNSTAKFSGTARLQGAKTAAASKSGKKKVMLTVRSRTALKNGQKVVLKLKSGKTTKVITVKAS